ncbi:MAG: hypothetical protein WBX25_23865 [Rhodomicrobium sp.]
MQGSEDQPSLAEVKAVLRKLQRLDFPAGDEAPQTKPQAQQAMQAARPSTEIRVFDRKLSAVGARRRKANPLVRVAFYLSGAITSAVVVCAVLIGTGVLKLPVQTGKEKSGVPEVLITPEVEAKVMSDARRSLSEGDVLSARNILQRNHPESHAEVAFVLAQSYDPNYLQSLPKSNVSPDREVAARWYHQWYELAVKSGLEMNSERLRRIINAMH